MAGEKRNCWEVENCGREPGGVNVDEMGVCPVAVADNFDGVNRGNAAGRFCWAVDQTMCGGQIQGTIAEKALSCMACGFYQQVVQEERHNGLVLHPRQLLE